MEMVFDKCECSDRQKIILEVKKLKTGVLGWWKLLVDSMPMGEEREMSWENFLE